jgi:hypothetical protein
MIAMDHRDRFLAAFAERSFITRTLGANGGQFVAAPDERRVVDVAGKHRAVRNRWELRATTEIRFLKLRLIGGGHFILRKG